MRRFYEGNDNKGYQEVVDKEAGLELIAFDLIRLEPGENAVYESGEYEIGLVILQGTCSVKVDDVTFDKLGSRRSVFDGKPTTVYVPRDSKYEVTATGSMMLEIGVCKVKARKKYEAFVIDAMMLQLNTEASLTGREMLMTLLLQNMRERLTESCLARLTACRDSGQAIHHINMIQIIFHLR